MFLILCNVYNYEGREFNKKTWIKGLRLRNLFLNLFHNFNPFNKKTWIKGLRPVIPGHPVRYVHDLFNKKT